MKKKFILFVILAVVLGLLAATATADQSAPQLTKANGNNVVVVEPKGATGLANYIIKLKDAPLGLYAGATLDARTPDSQAYLAHLDRVQAELTSAVSRTLGREANPVLTYKHAFNGIVIEMTPAEAAEVAKLPGIAKIYRERFHELLTDAGPAWIGADVLWNGTVPNFGEGTVAAVLDTGINFDHPSFADVGGDGYDHPAPAQYFGVCDPLDDQFDASYTCNDKLIGGYSFVSEAVTPEDSDGHGSHTASTVAGNFVDATIDAPTISVDALISGVAPHAHVIAMDVCTAGCPGTSILSAVEKVIELNGLFPGLVDAINFSISGGEDPYNDPTELAFLTANTVGVFVSASAGNSGPTPFTVAHRSPWLTTVAASTHNREFTDNLLDLVSDGASLPDIAGVGLTTGYGPANIVYAADYGDNLCFLGSFPAGTWSGEIVICDRGTNARVEKGQAVLAGGAGGMILADNGGGVVSDPHFLPATHINQADGTTVKDWEAANTNPEGVIEGTVSDMSLANGDIMAGFSSRGPNDTFDVIKPSVTAPGVNIWAAVADNTVPPDGTAEYNLLSGTSMSSPHNAGASLLVKAAQPSWNPQQIQAALMMTSVQDGLLKEDEATPADPFDMGSGRIQVDWAAQAGLVMNETEANFLAADGDDDLIRALNIPSMANSNCVGGTCSWTRTVQSSVGFPVDWAASSTGEYPVDVTPANFTLDAGGTQELTITADASAVADGTWRFANVVLTPSLPAGANGGGGGGTSYCSTPGLAIPDADPVGASDTISVGDAGTTTDVDVTIQATHTWVGDLVFTVAHGSSVTVIDQPGVPASTFGCSQNHVNATLDDEAGSPVEDTCAASTNPTPPPYAIDGAFTPNNALSAFDGAELSGDWTITVSDLAVGDTGTLTEWCVVISGGGGGATVPPVAHLPVAVIASAGSVPDLVEIEANTSSGSVTQSGYVSGLPVTDLQLDGSGLVEGSYFSYEMSTDLTNGDPFDNLNDGTVYYEVFSVPAGAHRLVAEIIASESPDIDLFVGTGITPSAETLVCFSATGIALEYCNVDDPTEGDWWVLVQDWEDSGNPPDTVILSAAVVADSDAGNFPLSGPAAVPAGQPFDVEIGWNEPTFETGDRWYGSFDVGTDAGNPGNIGTTNVNVVVNFPPTIDVNPTSMEATVAVDSSVTEPLNISNVGTGTLDWNIAEDITAGVDGGTITLTHSASQAIEQFNSVSCNAGGLHTDNSYLRRFDLNDFGITGNFDVSSVQVGVEVAAGGSGSQPITINLYTLSGSFVYANLTLIGTATVNIPDQALTVYEIPVVGTAPAGSELVVELFTPDGQTAGNSFFVGSNNDGQTGASYLVAADCGITEPTDTADIGFPDMHVVMNVLGTEGIPGTCEALVDIPWASVNPTSGSADAGETDTVDVTFNADGLATGVYTGTLCVTSNDTVNPLVQVPLTLTVEDEAPAITLDKTVGTDPATCAATDNIDVVAGTTVYYCYTVTNTGNVTLSSHDLTDDQLGNIFTGLPYDLDPGASVDSLTAGYVVSTTVMTDTTNVGTWVASVVGGPSVTATDSATVTVSPEPVLGISLAKTVGTDPASCAATDNLQVTAGTVVYYCLTVTNTGDTTLTTHDVVDAMLGVNLTGVAYDLLPGEDVNTIELGLSLAYTVTADATNTAMWMGYDDAGSMAMAEDSATVTLAPTDVSLTGFGADNNVVMLPVFFTMIVAFALAAFVWLRRRTAN